MARPVVLKAKGIVVPKFKIEQMVIPDCNVCEGVKLRSLADAVTHFNGKYESFSYVVQ